MLVITDKQEFQLVAPLAMGGGAFLLFLLLMRMTGDLNRNTWKALLAAAGLITYALYLTMWQNEIRRLWTFSPPVATFGVLLSLFVPSGLFFWIWGVQLAARREGMGQEPRLPKTDRLTELFRLFVLIWGTVNFLGLLIAVVYSIVRRR
jgi:hypothetical protein